MNASGSVESRTIRVLSPRMLPLVRVDDGSTANTATRCGEPVSLPLVSPVPSASMNVDLPTPGTPVIPTRRAPPERGSSRVSSSWARSRCSALVDSTRVIARRVR